MAIWKSARCPFSIEFSPEKLDQIRVAVAEGFYAVPRGGVEVGGVLFGRKADGKLEIVDYRKLETEYLTGPSFDLSEKDRAALRQILDETAFSDPNIRFAGWYHSHTRSPIHLSPKDAALHQEFFPEAWHVALVLKPDKLGNVRADYFFRLEDGQLTTEASDAEFTLPVLESPGEPEPEPETPISAPTAPEPPAQPQPAALFQSFAPPPKPASKRMNPWLRRTLMGILAIALIASAYLGYWFAVR